MENSRMKREEQNWEFKKKLESFTKKSKRKNLRNYNSEQVPLTIEKSKNIEVEKKTGKRETQDE